MIFVVELFVPAVELWVVWFQFETEAEAWGCYNDFRSIGVEVRVNGEGGF